METLGRILKLKELFDANQIPQLHKHEINPGLAKDDRINYVYFTLPVALNFQRSSPAMWQSALATYTDPETNCLFYPEEVVKRSFDELQSHLTKHKLALQKNKHVQIWQKLSNTLVDQYSADPRLVIKDGQNCVVRIKNILQIQKKKDFPYLSGEKMANYWLYILHNFTDIKLRNLHKITIIPDTHVIQSTVKLGLSDILETPIKVAALWDSALKGSELTPMDMHPVLWNWSRNGFMPEV